MTDATELLFVYGSLKRGARHHAELRGARYHGEARTEAGYALEEQGEYLALVELPSAGTVDGELFEVDAPRLAWLDEFEGDGYVRRTVAVRLAQGQAQPQEQREPQRQKSEIRFALAYLKRTR